MRDGIDPDALFTSIYNEWEKAEEDIKIAELVCGEVVIPAIQELRYAGRRLAQALRAHSTPGTSDDVGKLLQDACFNCHRARHDAIDASRSQVAKILDIAIDKLGYDVVLRVYPEFAALSDKLQHLGAKIAKSRGAPNDRDLIYEVIEKSDFPEFMEAYQRFRAGEGIMKKMAQRQRRGILISYIFGIGGLIGTVLSIVALYHP